MTASNITITSSLLGKFVTFSELISNNSVQRRGVIEGVLLDIHGNHQFLLDGFFYTLSDIQDFKITGVLS